MNDTKLAEIRCRLDTLADWGYGGRDNDPEKREAQEQQMIDDGYALYDAVIELKKALHAAQAMAMAGGQR